MGLGALSESLAEALLTDNPPDLVFVAVQEFAKTSDMYLPLQSATERVDAWTRAVASALKENFGPRRVEYQSIAVRSLGGVLLIVFARVGLTVRSVSTDAFGIGPALWLPNKALVSARVGIDTGDERPLVISFVASHLTPHPGGWFLKMRNRQATFDLFQRTLFEARDGKNDGVVETGSVSSTAPLLGEPPSTSKLTLWDSDLVVIAGDLNFRLAMPRSDILQGISSEEYGRLVSTADELTTSRKSPDHGLFPFFELPITFAPSYKYKGPTEFSKNRDPSYTDRILFAHHHQRSDRDRLQEAYSTPSDSPQQGVPVAGRNYRCFMSYNKSDHKPVSAELVVDPTLLVAQPRVFQTATDPWRETKFWVGVKLLAPPIGLVLHIPDKPLAALAVFSAIGVLVYLATQFL